MPSSGACANIINSRRKKNAYGTPANPENFLDQDFVQLKQYCLSQRLRYVDDMFPPDRMSIGKVELGPHDPAKIVWRRPRDLVPNPSFIVGGVSRFDFGQGSVGDCWFLASIGALTFQKNIFAQVVPSDQSFDEGYSGVFHFRFWRFGRWVDVVIDDKLPTIDGRLIFVHSKDPTEFWPALLEKAYAKVCGSYADMSAGTPSEALVDFTGGVHICVQLSEPPPDLWELMCRAGQSQSLMGCGTPQGETSANTVLQNGLVQGHAYTVTGVKQVISQGNPVRLVRLWNPWGQGEWKGDWSDLSPLWQTISPQDREQCQSVGNDGEFWMTLEDFCRFYDDLDFCSECPEFLDEGSSCHWKTSVYEGRWVAGTTAGGCLMNTASFWTNPQFRVKIDELADECSTSQGENNMLVSLMQKPDKRNRRLVQNLYIGFSVFEVTKEYEGKKGKFPASFFGRNKPVAGTKKFINSREMMELVALKPGEYLIVPCTYNPDETASFILTIISKAETHVHEDSGSNNHEHVEGEEHTPDKNETEEEKRKTIIRQLSEKYDAVNAELLQKILNDKVLKGDVKTRGFSIEACRSMVALLDTSLTGNLTNQEFVVLWNKVNMLKDIFLSADVSQSGTLSLSELRTALIASGQRISEDIFNLMALRYGSSSGQMALEDFISLALRLDCMRDLFSQLSNGMTMTLRKTEWLYLSMYN
ncbi:calpain-1 catalytic subunit-like isoform X2 [Notolabrus celidotus]|nr:calpain-1 catalytic subunit-like isoform X2 [Notolabrus celidotus]